MSLTYDPSRLQTCDTTCHRDRALPECLWVGSDTQLPPLVLDSPAPWWSTYAVETRRLVSRPTSIFRHVFPPLTSLPGPTPMVSSFKSSLFHDLPHDSSRSRLVHSGHATHSFVSRTFRSLPDPSFMVFWFSPFLLRRSFPAHGDVPPKSTHSVDVLLVPPEFWNL